MSVTSSAPPADPREIIQTERVWTGLDRVLSLLTLATALFTVPLLYVGGMVTTHEVGMAVPDWPRTFGENMFTYNFLFAPFGVQVEHSHRLLGAWVGLLASAALAVAIVGRRRVAWPLIGFAAVGLQGLLGGMRVVLNEWAGRDLAAFHACCAYIVVGLLFASAWVHTRTWRFAEPIHHPDAILATRSAWVALGVVYGQILLGIFLRHKGYGLLLHLGGALLVTSAVLWMAIVVFADPTLRRLLRWPARVLVGTFAFQIALGVTILAVSRMAGRDSGLSATNLEATVTSLHVVSGAILIASSVALLLQCRQQLLPLPASAEMSGSSRPSVETAR